METKQNTQHEIFAVSGKCEMCKDRIENAAKSLKGVSYADWDLNTRKITVDYNNSLVTLDAIQKAIVAAGHDNSGYMAEDDVYNNLPECCHYREK